MKTRSPAAASRRHRRCSTDRVQGSWHTARRPGGTPEGTVAKERVHCLYAVQHQGGIMLPSDMYSQPNAADPVLEERTVLDIVRRHGVRCSAVTRVDEAGGEARAYVLDDNLLLKVQRPHRLRPRTSLAKEAFFLNQLAASPDIVVPHVLGYGRHDNIEYIVMTRMQGVPALTVEITGGQRMAVLHQLGRTLRRLHSIPQAPFYDSALFPGNRTQDAFVARVRADLT